MAVNTFFRATTRLQIAMYNILVKIVERQITIGHKENTLSSSTIYSSDPSIYLSIYEDQQAEMSSSLGEWVFSGFVFDWLFRREAPRDGESERKRERMWRGDRNGGGEGKGLA